jgi:hypothetical protein
MVMQSISTVFARSLVLIGSGALAITGFQLASLKPAQAEQPQRFNSELNAATRISQLPPIRSRQEVVATLGTVSGPVNVVVQNDSQADITYQVIGDTEPRDLAGGEEAELTGLQVPITLSFYRNGGGLINPSVEVSPDSDRIHLHLNTADTLDNDRGVMVVEESGNIYLM